MLTSEDIAKLSALVTQRRDHFDEFDDDWQHDDGAQFWAMMPDLLLLAKDGLRFHEAKLTPVVDGDTAAEDWASHLFAIRRRAESYDPTVCPMNESAYTDFYQRDVQVLLGALAATESRAARFDGVKLTAMINDQGGIDCKWVLPATDEEIEEVFRKIADTKDRPRP